MGKGIRFRLHWPRKSGSRSRELSGAKGVKNSVKGRPKTAPFVPEMLCCIFKSGAVAGHWGKAQPHTREQPHPPLALGPTCRPTSFTGKHFVRRRPAKA